LRFRARFRARGIAEPCGRRKRARQEYEMATCPECDADIEVDEFDVDKGDLISCPECGSNLEVTGIAPVELEAVDDEEDEDDDAAEEEDDDLDDDDETVDDEEETGGEDWDE
jgi:alpha-aminoadipate/glutamate carrier protein LysW